MTKKTKTEEEKVVPLTGNVTPHRALEIVKRFIKEDKIEWHSHCLKQMKKRSITTMQVMNCLEKGTIKEAPFSSHKHGGCHEVAIEKVTAGEKIKVVVGLQFSQQMLMITAIHQKFGRPVAVKKEKNHEEEQDCEEE